MDSQSAQSQVSSDPNSVSSVVAAAVEPGALGPMPPMTGEPPPQFGALRALA